MNVSIVKSSSTGSPEGNVAIQTIIGQKDSRFVVKLGELKYGNNTGMSVLELKSTSLFNGDFLRFRIRWSKMEITLNDTANLVPDKFRYQVPLSVTSDQDTVIRNVS